MKNFEIFWEETSDLGTKEETRGGSIYVEKCDFVFEDFVQEIIIPFCKSVGYMDKTVYKYFGEM